MANIHDLIVKYDSTSPREGLFPIDLNCGDPETNKKISAGIYDLSQDPPEKVSTFVGSDTKMLTRIEDCDGSYVLVENTLGEVESFVTMLCEVCVDAAGGNVLGKDCDKPMHTKDCDRDSLIAKLQEQLDELVKIFAAVDGLELTTENIRIEAGQINLNTDQLEQLMTDLNALVALKGSDCDNALFVKDCGTQDLIDKLQEVIDAINSTSAGKVQDLLSWVASAGQTATIPSGKFSTMALFASKGEFTISNETNNFASDITFSGGTQSSFIEISEDGVGTATGATSTPQAIDTRTNANDMDLANNSFLITCVRDGVLSLELYK